MKCLYYWYEIHLG